jgi:uncharacterized protein DUF5615
MSREQSHTSESKERGGSSQAEPRTKPVMRLIVDENVPTWISDVFARNGHEVIAVTDLLGKSTSDEAIAIVGEDLNAIVFTRNWRHFREYTTRRLPHGQRGKFRRLGVIELKCDPGIEERRVREEIELIELEYTRRLTMHDTRVNVEIRATQLVIRR